LLKLTLRASLLAACVIASVAVPFASAAHASTISITVGADPAESITTQVGVTGIATEEEDRYYLKVKPAGGRGCAANAEADEGVYALGEFENVVGDPGNFAASTNWTFETAGAYLLCAWLQHNGTPAGSPTVVASTSVAVNIRQPHLSLSIQAPSTVLVGRTFQIAMTAEAETQREAFEYLLRNTGRGCPANADAAESTSEEIAIHPFGVDFDGGPSTVTDNESLNALGAYLVCAYFEYPHSYSVPELVASAALAVVKPSPPCVVPKLGSRRTLAAVERRIKSAHCRVGRVTYVSSSRYARGLAISLRPAPGTRLEAHAAVAVEVSDGPPRRPQKHRHPRHRR
jgi:hypothetical protein